MTELAQWFWQGMLWGAAVYGFFISMLFMVVTLAVIGSFSKKKKGGSDAGAS